MMKRKRNKASVRKKGLWCFFVAMATIFVVIELLQDRSTEAFLLAFIRITASYGSVKMIFSDNSAQ